MASGSASALLQAQESLSGFGSASALIEAGDSDGDDVLDTGELASLLGTDESDDDTSSIFDLLDSDDNGRIDAAELDQARDRG